MLRHWIKYIHTYYIYNTVLVVVASVVASIAGISSGPRGGATLIAAIPRSGDSSSSDLDSGQEQRLVTVFLQAGVRNIYLIIVRKSEVGKPKIPQISTGSRAYVKIRSCTLVVPVLYSVLSWI